MNSALQEQEDNYFSASSQGSLFKKRIGRIWNFRRLPISASLQILFSYCKQFLGIPLSAQERDLNYYFLTLIHCDCFTISIQPDAYYFQTSGKIKFTARRNSSSDLEVFNQVWGRKEYSKATQILKKSIGENKDTVIVDAGANAGYTSLFFYRDFPNASIYSIEPDSGNYSIILKNISLNKTSKIIPLQFGLWDRTCNLMVDRNYRDGREWSIQVIETDTDSGLRGVSIMDLMKDYHIEEIDLFKIDIEGAESHLFKDSESANFFLSRTKVIAIEIHDENVSRTAIYQLFKENNFSYFEFNDLTIAYKN